MCLLECEKVMCLLEGEKGLDQHARKDSFAIERMSAFTSAFMYYATLHARAIASITSVLFLVHVIQCCEVW